MHTLKLPMDRWVVDDCTSWDGKKRPRVVKREEYQTRYFADNAIDRKGPLLTTVRDLEDDGITFETMKKDIIARINEMSYVYFIDAIEGISSRGDIRKFTENREIAKALKVMVHKDRRPSCKIIAGMGGYPYFRRQMAKKIMECKTCDDLIECVEYSRLYRPFINRYLNSLLFADLATHVGRKSGAPNGETINGG